MNVARNWKSFSATSLSAVVLMSLFLCISGCRSEGGRTHSSGDIPSGARVLHFDYAGGRNIRTLELDGGIACQADGILGPLTYRAADGGSVRRLTSSEAAVLARIRRYVPSPTLRFTWLGDKFIVYDAIYGVCNGGLYWVMNGGCNEFYSATDTWMKSTVPGSPGWRCATPPWVRKPKSPLAQHTS